MVIEHTSKFTEEKNDLYVKCWVAQGKQETEKASSLLLNYMYEEPLMPKKTIHVEVFNKPIGRSFCHELLISKIIYKLIRTGNTSKSLEKLSLSSPDLSYSYISKCYLPSQKITKKSKKSLEKSIAKDPSVSLQYATLIKERFELGEVGILKVPYLRETYIRMLSLAKLS